MVSIRIILLTIAVSAALIAGLVVLLDGERSDGSDQLRTDAEESFAGPLTPEEQRIANPTVSNTMNPHARITTNKGVITLELFTDTMPITTGNFITLAESGFYDNTKFHRVIEGFMIQGGDPNSKGTNEALYGRGGPDSTVQDEFVEGELLTNTRGTIAMANTGQPNSGGSQFFINLVDNTGLDFNKEPLSSKHPVFGRVIEGMDVIDAIGQVETKAGDIPAEPIVLEKVEIVR
ncbi:MAG: peptidylprolyl isomerase [Candidatus Paceibacterota bacterium]